MKVYSGLFGQSQSTFSTLHHLIHSVLNMNHMHITLQGQRSTVKWDWQTALLAFLAQKIWCEYEWQGEQTNCHRFLWKWKNNWAEGLSHTLTAAFSLHVDDDPARFSCLSLPPPTHFWPWRKKKAPQPSTAKYSRTFSHPCEHERTLFSITKKFLGQMLISYGSGFRSWKNSSLSFSLSLYHKSFNSAAQTVLVSPLFPFDTMGINYIKAGLVNLVGASCKRHRELKLCGTMKIILPCVWLVQLLDTHKTSCYLFSHFPVNKSICLVSFRWPSWINPTALIFQCVHCIFRSGSCESVVVSWALGWQIQEGELSDLTHSYT